MIRKKQSTMIIFRLDGSLLGLLLLVLALFFSGCAPRLDSDFPEMSVSNGITDSSTINSSGEMSTSSPSEVGEDMSFRIASPFSAQTLDYIAKLYKAKQSGGWTGEENVWTMDLQVLNNFESDFALEVVNTPITGAEDSAIDQWLSAEPLPDIIYVDKFNNLLAEDKLLSLNSYLANNALLSPAHLPSHLLDACSLEGNLYGIPFKASVKLLFVNQSLLSAAGVNALPAWVDIAGLITISEKLKTYGEGGIEGDSQRLLSPFYQAKDLIAFLPASYSSEIGWMTYTGSSFAFEHPAFGEATLALRDFVSGGYAVESLSPETQTSFLSTDPRSEGRVGFWVGGSEELPRWQESNGFDLAIIPLPTKNLESIGRPAQTVYPIAISAQCKWPQVATDFAAFMALDEDALLLAARLEPAMGLLPVIYSESVWDKVLGEETFSESLLAFRDTWGEGYTNPATSQKEIATLIDRMLVDQSSAILDKAVPVDSVVTALEAIALES